MHRASVYRAYACAGSLGRVHRARMLRFVVIAPRHQESGCMYAEAEGPGLLFSIFPAQRGLAA